MEYIKLFNTTAEYNTYTAGDYAKPNVSYCVDANVVHYNPYVDPYAGHAYVEIGGLKWATMNVGANSITDTGLYFAWGDTQGYTAAQVGTDKNFTWNDYKYTNDGGSTMSKYNSSDGKTTLEASDDAAQAAWGGAWRMPTSAEFQALGNAVNTAWTADYKSTGIAGMVCTAKNGSGAELFFPAAGYCGNGSVGNVGSYGNYWSRSLSTDNRQNAYSLSFYNGNVNWQGLNFSRYYGLAVRPVVG